MELVGATYAGALDSELGHAVDHIARGAATQGFSRDLRDRSAEECDGRIAARRDVGGEEDVRAREDGMAGRERLGIEHVEPGAGEPAGFERGDQSCWINEVTARDIDEERAGFHPLQDVGRDEAAGLGIARAMQRHDFRMGNERIERGGFGTAGSDGFRSDHRIEHADMALEGEQALNDFAADPAEADDADASFAQGAERGKGRGEAPLARVDPGIVRHDLAGEGEQQGESVVGDFVDAIVRHVAHGDAVRTGGLEIDVIDADAVADDGAGATEGVRRAN
jgi:nucleoid-associated protein YgaU